MFMILMSTDVMMSLSYVKQANKVNPKAHVKPKNLNIKINKIIKIIYIFLN